MCLALALSAIRFGATCVNYTECIDLIKERHADGYERVVGAKVRDKISGESLAAYTRPTQLYAYF